MLRALFISVLACLAVAPAARGATVTIGLTSFPDFVDPALTYTQEGWQAVANAYVPLLTYPPAEGADGTQLIPGLAEGLPAVSPDGLTYTLTLRRGVKYANGRAVQARDVEHAIKRVFNLESGGTSFYLAIAGAEEYVAAGRARADIPGITTRGRTIEFRLTRPEPAFPHILALPFASPVPSSTPFDNVTRRPPPGTGPYTITRSRPGRRGEIRLRRNRRFSVPGFARPKVADVRLRVMRGAGDLGFDSKRGRGITRRDVPTLSTYFFFLNHRVPPFDRKEVREAVNLAIDKQALARLFGGQLDPGGCTFLPRGIEGFAENPGCPFADPPDVERARQLVQAAGVAGQKVDVYGNDEDPAKPSAAYLTDVLNRIGFRAETKILEASVYFTTVGNRNTAAQAGFANWFADMPHPLNFLFLVHGRSIQATNNQNYGNVDDPVLNGHIDAGRWTDADRRIVEEAHVAPFGSRRIGLSRSRRVPARCAVFHFQRGFDLSRLCTG